MAHHLGTPQKLTSISGAIIWSAKYNSFGKVNIDIETAVNNLRSPGQYFDEETGLHYNCFRYYDPSLGRYLKPDPVGFEGGNINLYAYVQNSPLKWIDPKGLECRDCDKEYEDCVMKALNSFVEADKALQDARDRVLGIIDVAEEAALKQCDFYKQYGDNAYSACVVGVFWLYNMERGAVWVAYYDLVAVVFAKYLHDLKVCEEDKMICELENERDPCCFQ